MNKQDTWKGVIFVVVLLVVAWFVSNSGTPRATKLLPLYSPPRADVQTPALPVRGHMIITEELSSPISYHTYATVTRGDVWVWVEIDGGKANGGYEYETPPWNEWKAREWTPPAHAGTSVRYKLVAGKNGNVHEAEFEYKPLDN